MPYVRDEDWAQYAPGGQFPAGSFTGDADNGRRQVIEYDGARIFARLRRLLPNPGGSDEGAPGRLFRTK